MATDLVYPRGPMRGWVEWDSLSSEEKARLSDTGPDFPNPAELMIKIRAKATKLNDDAAEQKAAPLPPPEIPMRVAQPEELADCTSARTLLSAATESGWLARATYSKGPRIDVKGEFLDVRECIMVSGTRRREGQPPERFLAMWMKDLRPKSGATKISWSFDHAHYVEGNIRTRVNGNEIKEKVKS